MQGKWHCLALLGGLSLAAAARAQSAPVENGDVRQLLDEFRERQTQYYANVPPSGVLDGNRDPVNEYGPKFRALAEKYAGQVEALPALSWLISNCGGGEDAKWALDVLVRDHAGRPEIVQVMFDLQFEGPMIGALYDAVLAQNKDREALARATFQKGVLLASERFAFDRPPAGQQQGLELFKKVVQEYAGTKVARWAESWIFEIEKLQVGMTAPDFVGKDVDGREIRLSDYRGQVVALSFWGSW
jgi:hypothetical protein